MEENRELIIIREFDVPADVLWKYWTDARLIQQWWGPKGVTNPICEWHAEPKGIIHIVMLAGKELGQMSGQEWPMTGEFLEVKEPKKLVFTSRAIMNGKPILENAVTVVFEEENGKTRMTVRIVVTKTTPEAEGPLQGMQMGWNQQIDKLQEQIATK